MLLVKLIRRPALLAVCTTAVIIKETATDHANRADNRRAEVASANAAVPSELTVIVRESMSHGWLMLKDDDPRRTRSNQDRRAQRSYWPAMKVRQLPVRPWNAYEKRRP